MQQDENNQQNETVSDKKSSNEKPKGEITFMSLQIRVVRTKFNLSVRKVITPMEANVLTLIELGTIGGQNKFNKFCSLGEFDLNEMNQNLNYKDKNKIYGLLKKLTEKGLIHRQHTSFKNLEILGLNPDVFGQILIDSLHKVEQERIRLVVDNSKNEHTNRVVSTHEPCVNHLRSVCDEHTNRVRPDLQASENIEQNFTKSGDIETVKHLRQENKIDNFSQDWANHDPKNFAAIRDVLKGNLK